MRQIKFRAWDKKGEYFKPIEDDGDYYFRDDGDGLCLYDKWGECKETVLLQFTGLQDKNGKDIYEGDIIEWNRGYADDSSMDLWPNKPYVCKFESGKFFLHCTPNGSGGYILSFDGRQNKKNKMVHCEIIGNIYEHPHLLNSEQEVQECDATDDHSSTSAGNQTS